MTQGGPDTLLFYRCLPLTGDSELGLVVKNLPALVELSCRMSALNRVGRAQGGLGHVTGGRPIA